MNELKIFENAEFGKVRTVVVNDEPYLVGSDVAEILGYKNTRKALSDHVDEEDKRILKSNDLEPLENQSFYIMTNLPAELISNNKDMSFVLKTPTKKYKLPIKNKK